MVQFAPSYPDKHNARDIGATVVYHPVRISHTDEALQRRSSICRLLSAAEQHMSGLNIPCYVAHCEVLSATLVRGIQGGAGDRGRAAISLSIPVLLLTQQNLLVMEGGGVFEIERFPLTGDLICLTTRDICTPTSPFLLDII